MKAVIYIGYDPREAVAYDVARASIADRLSRDIEIKPIVLDEMRQRGLYSREHEIRDGRLWDVISEAPMATEFAISRFLTYYLAWIDDNADWALFIDCDFLALDDVAKLFDRADPRYAAMCVKHHHEPPEGVKMDGQAQIRYARKNWSSCMLFNTHHPSNRNLKLDAVNTLPGRDLHRFCWLDDSEIGDVSPEWNYLVGHTKLQGGQRPRLVHFTEGTPDMPGYEHCEFAGEWRQEAAKLQKRFLQVANI